MSTVAGPPPQASQPHAAQPRGARWFWCLLLGSAQPAPWHRAASSVNNLPKSRNVSPAIAQLIHTTLFSIIIMNRRYFKALTTKKGIPRDDASFHTQLRPCTVTVSVQGSSDFLQRLPRTSTKSKLCWTRLLHKGASATRRVSPESPLGAPPGRPAHGQVRWFQWNDETLSITA